MLNFCPEMFTSGVTSHPATREPTFNVCVKTQGGENKEKEMQSTPAKRLVAYLPWDKRSMSQGQNP